MLKKVLLLLFLLVLGSGLFAQDNYMRLGSPNVLQQQRLRGVYDYSRPETINMDVAVWGFVKYPGKYRVPIYATVSDLLSYAGGPKNQSNLEDLRLYRVMEDSSQHLFSFDFNDLLWSEELETRSRKLPKLQANDLLVVPGEPRLYFKDWFRISLSIFTAIISLSLLIIRLNKDN